MRRRGAVKCPVSITVLTAMAVIVGMVTVPGLQAAARASGSGGNASLSLSKTVTGASFAPTLLASLSADRATAIPGDRVTYTAHLTNAGAVLTVTGSISAQDGNDAAATVVDWYDEIEFHNKATNAWTPIGGYQATQPGWTPVNPSPVTTGLAVTMTPAAATGQPWLTGSGCWARTTRTP